MPETLKIGDAVVDFRLQGIDGKTYNSEDARTNGLLCYVFWKKTCGTCQYSFPYLQRFHDQYAGGNFQIWGIAQENAADAREFAANNRATFPQLIDEGFAVSEAYHLTNVPTIYLTDGTGRVLRQAPAFVADEYNAIARTIADRFGIPYTPIVLPEDNAPAIKPG